METNTTKTIQPKQAYEWVKTGHWTRREFEQWLTEKVNMAYCMGHEDGCK